MSTTDFIKRILGPTQRIEDHSQPMTLRYAVASDAEALDRLAQLDSQRAPRGVVLVAEVNGELWAAISLDDQHAVADPFRPTGELVALLLQRSRQLRRSARRGEQRLPRVWPTAGYDRTALN